MIKVRTQSILPKAGGNSGHGERNEVVQVSVGRVGKLQGPRQIKPSLFSSVFSGISNKAIRQNYRIKTLCLYT